MKCMHHPEVDSSAVCVSCGTPLCAPCRRDVEGSVYCEKCLSEMIGAGGRASAGHGAGAYPPGGSAGASHGPGTEFQGGAGNADPRRPQSSAGGDNPGLAFALGLIPGVGAIYNGDFFKAAVHILIFGSLVSMIDAAGPAEGLFTLFGVGFYCYMPFEAYYTAKKRKLRAEGIDLETPIDRFHEQFGGFEDKELWGGVALVVLGFLFLADTFRFFLLRDVFRFWPVGMIALGIWLVLKHRESQPPERHYPPGGRRPERRPENDAAEEHDRRRERDAS